MVIDIAKRNKYIYHLFFIKRTVNITYISNLLFIVKSYCYHGKQMITTNIKILLIKKNMKLKELSEKTGIGYSYLSRMSNNQSKDFNKEHIAKICEVLECDVGELIGFEKDKKIS